MNLDMPQPDQAVDPQTGALSREWVAFMTKLTNDTVWRSRAGTTAERPTDGLEVGTPYFDTTLGKPIWVKVPTGAPVWVDATGAVV